MATKIRFMGPADVRVLGPQDLKRSGVENFNRTEFPRGREVEVTDQVAKALLTGTRVFGRFVPVAEAKFQEPRELEVESASTPATRKSK